MKNRVGSCVHARSVPKTLHGGDRRSSSGRGVASRRFAALSAVLLVLPVLVLGLASGTASASDAGTVSNYTGTGISSPYAITAGPNGSLWFANSGNSSIGEI